VGIGANGYELSGSDADRLQRAVRDTPIVQDRGAQTLGTISGEIRFIINEFATGTSYGIGKDGDKATEYLFRVYYDEPNDRIAVEFWDQNASTDHAVYVGSGLTFGTEYYIAFGYDSVANEIWATINGSSSKQTTALPGTFTQGANAGYLTVGGREGALAGWGCDGDLDLMFLWPGRVLTDAEIDFLATGARLADFGGVESDSFGWDCESDASYTGRIIRGPEYSDDGAEPTPVATCELSAVNPISGTKSIINDGANIFAQAQFYNSSIRPQWGATLDEGYIKFDLRVLTYLTGSMAFMLDGKADREGNGDDAVDNNNAITLFFKTTETVNKGFSMVRGLPDTTIDTSGFDLSLDPAIYKIEMRWNKNVPMGNNTMELWINDSLEAFSNAALPALTGKTFVNHITVLNDTTLVNHIQADDIVINGDSGLT
jgi:hypothetical protein